MCVHIPYVTSRATERRNGIEGAGRRRCMLKRHAADVLHHPLGRREDDAARDNEDVRAPCAFLSFCLSLSLMTILYVVGRCHCLCFLFVVVVVVVVVVIVFTFHLKRKATSSTTSTEGDRGI